MSSEEQGELQPPADSCQPTPKPLQSKIPFLRLQPGQAPLLVSTSQHSVDGQTFVKTPGTSALVGAG